MSTILDVSCECISLRNLDLTSKTDAYVVGLMYNPDKRNWDILGKTEVIMDNLNPKFATKIPVPYSFGKVQKVKFIVYDYDSAVKSEVVGETEEIDITVLLKSKKLSYTIQSRTFHKDSQLILMPEEVSNNKEVYQMEFSGSDIKSGKLLARPDPFYEIHYQTVDEKTNEVFWKLCYTSNWCKNTKDPVWEFTEISSRALCNGDARRDLKFVVLDYEEDGSHRPLGEFITNVGEMRNAPISFELKKDSKAVGKLTLKRFSSYTEYSFADYIAAGMQIQVTTAVDLTGSNGNPTDPRSLHYCLGKEPNAYMRSIEAVTRVLIRYDTDQTIPLIGFGARVNKEVTHCWNYSEPKGVEQTLADYKKMIHECQLEGPTLILQILEEQTVKILEDLSQGKRNYYILVIHTDGALNDYDKVCRWAREYSMQLPLSVILVGIGNADFSTLQRIDDMPDVARDMFQFAKYEPNTERLAYNLLEEVPEQFIKFAKFNKWVPNL